MTDMRCVLEHGEALGVLLRTIVVEREPISRHPETVSGSSMPTVHAKGPFKQPVPARPTAATKHQRVARRHFALEWSFDEEAIAYDHKTDGVYPLPTNDRGLSPRQVLEAHTTIEKRFEQVKTVHRIAPATSKASARMMP